MLVSNRKFDEKSLNNNTKILCNVEADFIILNDNTYINLEHICKIKRFIESYNYRVEILLLNQLMESIKEYLKSLEIELKNYTIVAIGEGGKKAVEALNLNLNFSELKWSRVWKNNVSEKFITNVEEFDYSNKEIILIEDVIATGETLFNVVSEIEKRGGKIIKIISAIINEGSPLSTKSFKETIISKKIKNKFRKDPYWYPAIYSTRHLFYGDNEMPNFYKIFNEKYFRNEDKIEKEIKKMRSE